ncbi:MAG: ribosome biogenesis GTPase Der [Acidobacteria bacterium RBG_13_68_16]|nr:MAG: ribosome biogenesis GTPase Der [Acidobacteria bacterium RBG_13_68_16]
MPPTVAIVGRPNVGKSTLFNRLARSRRAITHDLPGVTRDRVAADAPRPTGGVVVVVDTGGFEPESEAEIPAMVREQALLAVAGADAVVLVVDGAQGLLPPDREIAAELHKAGTPTVVAVNKLDRRDAAHAWGEFTELGFPVVEVAAEHGLGTGELWEELEKVLPAPQEEIPEEAELAVAIVGRPNVGKSSLLNRLLGEERVLVSEVPGTTRDSVDTLVACGGRTVRLIDTAGIRRKGRTDKGPEVLSVIMATRAIERAQVCLVLVDAGEGLTAQDTHVAGYVSEAGRGAVVVVNKADLIAEEGREGRERLKRQLLERLKFLKDTPVLFASATTGAGVAHLLPAALEVGEAFKKRVATGELNRVLRAAWERQPPPGGKRPPRLYYATQTASGPPRFALFVSGTGKLHFSYQRYLENKVREAFPLAGVPIRFNIRGKRDRAG